MVDVQAVVEEIAGLPTDKQQEVADFVAFLRARMSHLPLSDGARAATEPTSFFGMWADRPDMVDSAAWVRRLRKTEWESRHA